MVRAGLFDASLRRGQDFDLWLRMAKTGSRFTYLRKVLALRRIHSANLSGTPIDQIERALAVFDKTMATMDLTRVERAAAGRRVEALTLALARERGKQRLREGDFASARGYLATASRSGWKVRAALLGLRVAPALVRRLYIGREAARLAS